MDHFNESLFQSLYAVAHHSAVIDGVIVFCASYTPYIIVAILVYFYFRKNHTLKDRKMVAISVTAGVVARFIVKGIIVYLYPHIRPYAYFSDVHPLITQIPSEAYQSFPSGHAIFFFALATTIYIHHKKFGTLLLFAAMAMSIARVMGGVHWPLDIVGGIVFGMLAGYGVLHFYEKYKKNLDPILNRVCGLF